MILTCWHTALQRVYYKFPYTQFASAGKSYEIQCRVTLEPFIFINVDVYVNIHIHEYVNIHVHVYVHVYKTEVFRSS